MMKGNACLIIGNVREGEYEGLLADGVEVLLLADTKPTAKIADAARLRPVARYDFSQGYGEELRRLVAALHMEYAFTSVLNFRESYVAISEQICQGHPALQHLQRYVTRTLDKLQQRARFNASTNSDLHVVSRRVTMEALLQQADTLIWPCVLKPASLYSSLFVKCLHSAQDLARYALEEWPELQAYVAGKSRETSELLLEEYLSGSNHSIDCAITPDGEITTFPIVDVIAGVDIQRPDFHHFARYSPSTLQSHEETVARCHRLARDAVAALGLRGTFAHVEFILTTAGPRILEVGARPGGSRIYVIRQAWGIEMDACYHRALSGQPLNLPDTPASAFGIATPFARHNIVWQTLQHEEQIRRIAGFQQWYAWVTPGETIGPVGNGFQNYVYIEFRRPDTAALRESLLQVAQIDVYGERRRPAVIVVGGRDSSINWPGSEEFDMTLIQTPAQLTPYQRQHADVLLTERLDDLAHWLPVLQERHRQRPFSAIVSFNELGLMPAALAGEQLGICHNPRRSVAQSRDKLLFRQLLADGPWALPASRVHDRAQALAFVQRYGASIIKPIAGSGSQGIYAVNTEQDLRDIPFDGNQQIEVFARGDEFSVETLSLDGAHRILGITRKYTTGAPHYVETGHDFPALLSPEDERRIAEAVLWLLQALGHRWGPAHTEVKLDGQHLQFIETQTRFGGDQIWEMVWGVTGIHQAAATIAAMAKVTLPATPAAYQRMAIRFPIAAEGGEPPSPLPAGWLLRAGLQPEKFGRPVRCSSERHGYWLFGCQASDETAFLAALADMNVNPQFSEYSDE
ncbi:ATP-grasp domain-containing protein [Serratia rhizosphaerae]|uniref:ATP-grasp domain-containing protein n=1 Tax=Serratia rhizosphaerae TaxID=2597702 RepID=A0ABX6GQ94_9GAMM|nr:ATP-grasp domain-containing protein [Serratia rhizosphaerae]QHA88461.1 ATP-grasp domain-containing protein [Serratia rhizosphaerae]